MNELSSEHSSSRLKMLEANLEQAKRKAKTASSFLKRAQHISDKADEAVSIALEKLDLELLLSWGDRPDVAVLLKAKSSILYQAFSALAQAYGLGIGGVWTDTKQHVLHICLNRGETDAVEQAKKAVLFFAPYIKPGHGMKRFSVRHREMSDFSVELSYSVKTQESKISRLEYGQVCDVVSFKNLDDALHYVQEHHWIEDIIEMESSSDKLVHQHELVSE